MNGDQRLNEFLELVDVWVECKGLPKFSWNAKAEEIINLRSDELKKLTSIECLEKAFELNAFAEYLLTEKHRDESILDWAENSIWYIISKEVDQYGDKYTKWQQKYFSAVRENPLARELLKIQQHSKARINAIGSQPETMQKMAHLLIELSKRK